MDQETAQRRILALTNCDLCLEDKKEMVADILSRLVESKISVPKMEVEVYSDASSDVCNKSAVDKKKKRIKDKKPPLDKEDFARRFRENPSSIKKWELAQAVGDKSGYGLSHLCPDIEGKGSKILGQKMEVLKNIIANHLDELSAPFEDAVEIGE
tara:strand:+ start:341 stop:805 length:465 start_codon:yes stop_codon:yes gene_type:complete